MSDALVLAAQAGDAEAFAGMVRGYAPRVLRFLTVTGVPHHDAEDLVQETFLRVHRHLAVYDPSRPFTTWLFTIANRLRLNWAQRRARGPRPLDGVAEPASGDPDPALAAVADAPTWRLARRVLNERQFQLLWLRYGEDLDAADCARTLGISVINARVTLHRARTALARRLAAGSDPLPASTPAEDRP